MSKAVVNRFHDESLGFHRIDAGFFLILFTMSAVGAGKSFRLPQQGDRANNSCRSRGSVWVSDGKITETRTRGRRQ